MSYKECQTELKNKLSYVQVNAVVWSEQLQIRSSAWVSRGGLWFYNLDMSKYLWFDCMHCLL